MLELLVANAGRSGGIGRATKYGACPKVCAPTIAVPIVVRTSIGSRCVARMVPDPRNTKPDMDQCDRRGSEIAVCEYQ